MLVDLFGQGESTSDGKPIARNRLNASGHEPSAAYAGYTYGYNYPLFAQRVHDILTAVAYARHSLGAEKVDVVGLGGAGHWVAAARAQAGAAIDRAVVDTAGFRFAKLKSIDDADFLPGGAKYLDLPGLMALSAPYPLWLAGEGEKRRRSWKLRTGPPDVPISLRCSPVARRMRRRRPSSGCCSRPERAGRICTCDVSYWVGRPSGMRPVITPGSSIMPTTS